MTALRWLRLFTVTQARRDPQAAAAIGVTQKADGFGAQRHAARDTACGAQRLRGQLSPDCGVTPAHAAVSACDGVVQSHASRGSSWTTGPVPSCLLTGSPDAMSFAKDSLQGVIVQSFSRREAASSGQLRSGLGRKRSSFRPTVASCRKRRWLRTV